jgi:hypothetical protein
LPSYDFRVRLIIYNQRKRAPPPLLSPETWIGAKRQTMLHLVTRDHIPLASLPPKSKPVAENIGFPNLYTMTTYGCKLVHSDKLWFILAVRERRNESRKPCKIGGPTTNYGSGR